MLKNFLSLTLNALTCEYILFGGLNHSNKSSILHGLSRVAYRYVFFFASYLLTKLIYNQCTLAPWLYFCKQ